MSAAFLMLQANTYCLFKGVENAQRGTKTLNACFRTSGCQILFRNNTFRNANPECGVVGFNRENKISETSVQREKSNLAFYNGHNNTTKGVTKINDISQIILPAQNNIQQGFIINVEKCVKIMTTTFERW